MEQLKSTTGEEVLRILRIIDYLLSEPAGLQLYRKELSIMFTQLELLSKPIWIVPSVT